METDFEKEVREFLAKSPFGYRKVSEEDLALFCAALTHDSFSNEALNMDPPRKVPSYERLEFLGDSVLEFLVCEHIYRDTDISEGPMTDYKQDKVANHMLSERILAKGIDIDGMMRVGHGHMKGQTKDVVENMRADCFEAVIAAVCLAYGLDEARRIVHEIVIDD
ncbi:ribonuclease III domain-containing protein [Methanomassiliicoccales archaeon LGM-RCC1]|nr:ribonuclease III domain-containing protein [Methanomassiliicoccales archaeon LGM-RCC1]